MKLNAGKLFRNRDTWIVIGGAAAAITAVAVISGKSGGAAQSSLYAGQDQSPVPGSSMTDLAVLLAQIERDLSSRPGTAPTTTTPEIPPFDISLPIGPGPRPIPEPPVALLPPSPAVLPATLFAPGLSAADLAKAPAGGWTAPPPFQQISPTKVLDTTGGGSGGVNPENRLVGYSNPVTGEFRKTPFAGGAAMWA